MRHCPTTQVATLLALSWCSTLLGDEPNSTNLVKASLVFRSQSSSQQYAYPHIVRVYLCLENQADKDVTLGFNYIEDIQVEVLNHDGKPPRPPAFMAGSVQSNPDAYTIPHHSKYELEISHGGVSMGHWKTNTNTVNQEYALIVGGGNWLIPTNEIQSYTMKATVRGWPSVRDRFEIPSGARPEQVLFDIPKTAILIETNLPDLK